MSEPWCFIWQLNWANPLPWAFPAIIAGILIPAITIMISVSGVEEKVITPRRGLLYLSLAFATIPFAHIFAFLAVLVGAIYGVNYFANPTYGKIKRFIGILISNDVENPMSISEAIQARKAEKSSNRSISPARMTGDDTKGLSITEEH